MGPETETFLYLGVYNDPLAARADFDTVKDLHALGVIGTYDSAVITKESDGKLHMSKDSIPTRKGAWGGIGVGAVLGLLFPPSIIVTAAVGGMVGGVGMHLWKGLSRSDLKELGEALDEGQAALLVIGDWRLQEQLKKAFSHAEKRLVREIKGLERAQAEQEIGRLMSGAGAE